MKGGLIKNHEELKNGQLVYVEFDYYNVTIYCDEEYEEHLNYAEKVYVPGVFKVERNENVPYHEIVLRRVYQEDEDMIDSLMLAHNFVDEVYEWVEEECSWEVKCEKDDSIQITELKEVLTNSLLNMLLDNDIKDRTVTFLKYQKFGTYVEQDELRLLKEVNEQLKAKS